MKTLSVTLAGLFLLASPGLADTLTGKAAYKNAEGNLVAKSAEIELSPDQIDAIKLKIENELSSAEKIKVKSVEGENRTVVLAAFRNVRDMPEGTTLIVRGSLLKGKNGNLFHGDLFTRTCKASQGDQGFTKDSDNDDEDSFLEKLVDGVHSIQDRTGCTSEYRGGMYAVREADAGGDQ